MLNEEQDINTIQEVSQEDFNTLKFKNRFRPCKNPIIKKLENIPIGNGIMFPKTLTDNKRPSLYAYEQRTGKKFSIRTTKNGNYFAIQRLK